MDRESIDSERHPEAPLPPNYFELYRLAVEMADRISARRGIANSFFLTLSVALVGGVSTGETDTYLSTAGIAVCVVWWSLLRSYRSLNSAKYSIILSMEEMLPVQVFGDEWGLVKTAAASTSESTRRAQAVRRWASDYQELSRVEAIVPVVFAGIFIADILEQSVL